MTEEKPRKRQAITIGLAMVVSLWIHIIVLALWRYSPPVPDHPVIPPLVLEIELPDEPPVTETAEVEPPSVPEKPAVDQDTPPPEDMPEDLAEDNEPVPEDTIVAQDEDTISLESKAPEYISYLAQIKARVSKTWHFPDAARKKRLTGRVTLLFTLNTSGELLKSVIEQSSNHQVLDQAAQVAILNAAPYPPFPDHIKLKLLNIRANFDYRIRFVTVQ